MLKQNEINMDEHLLQHIWQHQLYNQYNMQTTQGARVEVISHGILNTNAGPDFFNAQIMIGNIKWYGCIEIHKKSSDWNVHKHSEDKLYNSVVLHVVAEYDCDIVNSTGTVIPTLVLDFNQKIAKNYMQLTESKRWIACEDHFNIIDPLLLSMWTESLAIERIERKSENILKMIDETQSNYNEVFYRLLSINLGFKTNAEPFEMVSRLLPLKIIRKFADNIIRVEAALFGQAGFLEHSTVDEYHARLKQEFGMLKHRFSLSPIDVSIWKFFRMRPSNFPPQRIAQLASIIVQGADLIGLLLSANNLTELISYFKNPVSDYWKNHVNFGKKSKKSYLCIGKESINNIFINTVVPFAFVYGIKYGDQKLKDKALSWLENIEAENNSALRKWQTIGANIENAKQSQAFLELKNEYCANKKCLQCRIGSRIVAEV